ncbi:MAG TPA: DUF2341 domain-containing protein, partial [Candidatus Woesebacteria bacterium]|nr:DUF2341 domain-containing protein [Candidatus Woesebacteria bacterium]
SWHYRQAIDISSHTTAESNVYITTTINISSATKAQNDDGDFRFVDQSGQILNYYIVSGVGTTNITFHVLIPSFTAGSSTIYTYYNNSTADDGFSASDFSTQASNYTLGSYSSEETGGGPIAYWKFDEGVGTTAYDSSSNKVNINIGTSWNQNGQCISNSCLQFANGSSNYSKISDSSSLNLGANDFSISVWVKINNGFSGRGTIIQKGNDVTWSSNPPQYGYWLTAYNSKIYFYIADGSNFLNISSVNNYNDGVWHHIAIVANRSDTLKMFVDGKLISIVNMSSIGNINNNYSPGIGCYQGSASNILSGSIDELKVYNYARTAAQIKLDYNSRGSSKGTTANLGIKSSTAPSLSSKLIAYYKFDEGSGNKFYDSITNYVAGASSSTAPTWQNSNQCYKNKCLSFNDNSGISLGNGSNLDFSTGDFTISVWINQTSSANNKKIIFKGNPFCDTCIGGYTLFTHAGVPHFDVNLTTASGDTFSTYNSSLTINDGKWHFVAGQRSGDKIKLFVDGKFISNTSLSTGATIVDNSSFFYISGNSPYSYDGLIDEVKIYNSALTDDEVKQDYNQGSAISFGSTSQTIGGTTTSLEYCIPGDTSYCASPVAEYNFEENTGTVAKDTSGNNNNGTISGATWTTGQNNKGAGLNFIANQYINISTLSPTINNKYLTIEGWINFSSLSGVQRIFSISGSNPMIGITSGTLFIHTTTSTGSDNNIPYTTLPNNCQTNWHFLTVTWDTSLASNNIKVYCDGVNFTNGTLINGLNGTFNINKLFIGYNNSNQSLNGKIDGVKIYDYARTPAQIAYDYNRGGPIGWWKFDECQGSIANDSSGLGNTGVISIGQSGTQNSLGTCQIGTSAAWTNGASGKYNSSLNFDGTDDRVYGSFTAIGITKPFSMSIWFKTSTTFGYQPGIASLGYSPVIVMKTDGKINVWWYDGSVWPGIDSLQELNNNIWHNVILSYNGITASLYIDGIFQSSLNSTINAVYSGFDIGNEHNGGYKYFNGQIDDYRIYNYGLTPDQIKILYNNGSINFQ